MNPSVRRLVEAAKANAKQKQVIKPDPTSVRLVLDAPDDNEHAVNQKPIAKSVAEANVNEVAVVAFGRMNPPTIGHEKLIQKMAAVAKQHNTRAKLYLSQTQGAKTDPLNYATKLKLASKAFGKHVDVINDPSVKTFFDLPRTLDGTARHLIVVAGSDRLPEYKKKLDAYNGKEYTFDKIEVVSAGERDPDADGTEGMSASKARALAKAGDVGAFKEVLPTSVRADAKPIMDAVRKGMNMNEENVPETYTGKDSARPGWMLRADPKLGMRVEKAIDIAKKRNASHGSDNLVKKEDIKEAYSETELRRLAKGIPLRGRYAPGGDKDGPRFGGGSIHKRTPQAGDKFTGKDGRRWERYRKADGTLGVKPLKEDNNKRIDEAMTMQARMKRRMAMNRLKVVMRAARRRALRKRADTPTLERRARKRARDLIRQRILKTVNYQDLPLSARGRVDALVAKRRKAISRIAMKMLPRLKRAEMSRKLGATARLPDTGGPRPATESFAAMAVHNFLMEGASAPHAVQLIGLAAIPAYEAWCMTRGARISNQQRAAISQGLTGTVVAPGKRAGEWIVESATGHFVVPEYLANEAALVAATSHLRITD